MDRRLLTRSSRLLCVSEVVSPICNSRLVEFGLFTQRESSFLAPRWLAGVYREVNTGVVPGAVVASRACTAPGLHLHAQAREAVLGDRPEGRHDERIRLRSIALARHGHRALEADGRVTSLELSG